MGINISMNGVTISGNSSIVRTTVNGQDISENSFSFGNLRKFDERKKSPAHDVDRIIIKSNSVDVYVTAKGTSYIEAHFSGEAKTDTEPIFNISKKGREVVIFIEVGNVFMSNLTLDVSLPVGMFEHIEIQSKSGDIHIKESVSAKRIELESNNGTVECDSPASELSVNTYNGDIHIYVQPALDINVQATSHNGDIFLGLNDVEQNSITARSYNGTVRNHFSSARHSGHLASGRVETHNGNVTIS